jgi:hypothetical protein
MQQGWLFLRLTETSNDAHEPNHSVSSHPPFLFELGFFLNLEFCKRGLFYLHYLCNDILYMHAFF